MDIFTELDLSPERVRGYVAGLRPYRQHSPRLEVEMVAAKTIGHNYGHGGSGITMSWGAAAEIVEMLAPRIAEPCDVAVLGAGIMGLCTAYLLADRGHRVTVYAEDFPPHTTSDIAGGLWAPTHVGLGQDELEAARLERILRRSWEMFRGLDGALFGVEEAPLFEADDRTFPLDPMPTGLVEPAQRLERLPFTGIQPAGQVSRTLLIESPRFLRRLVDEVKARDATLEQRVFRSAQQMLELSQPVIVNCLGLGATAVAADPDLMPVRGQLVLLDPAPKAFFLDHAHGYVISRRDVLILGGTFEEGEGDPRPQDHVCERILNKHREYFTTW